jgi:hypothetical protein
VHDGLNVGGSAFFDVEAGAAGGGGGGRRHGAGLWRGRQGVVKGCYGPGLQLNLD